MPSCTCFPASSSAGVHASRKIAGAHEQRVRAVIDILPAEIPDLQPGHRPVSGGRQGSAGHQHAMRRWHRLVVGLAAQSAAKLGLADPPVAEGQQLNIGHRYSPGVEILDMGAQGL